MLLTPLLGIAFYVASIVFGIVLVNFFLSRFLNKRIFQYAAGIPIGFAISAYMVLALEVINGVFLDWTLVIVVVIEALLSYCLLNRSKSNPFSIKGFVSEIRKSKGLHACIFALAAMLIIFQAFALSYSANGTVLASSNYGGDLLAHLGYGQSLIYTGFPPVYPYSYGAKTVFPFITDFYSAILFYNGFSIVWAFNAMKFLLWFSLAGMLMFFLTLLCKNYKISAVAILMFLFFSLGFNFVIWYYFNWGPSNMPATLIQSMGKQNFSGLLTSSYFNFTDPFEGNLVIQNDYLLGFPYALVIISALYMLFLEPGTIKKKLETKSLASLAFLGLLTGLMPLIHPVSLEFLLVFCAVLFVYSMLRKWGRINMVEIKRRVWPWIVFGAIAIAIALPLVFYILSQHLDSGFISQIINMNYWYSQNLAPWGILIAHLEFWLEAIGITLPLGVIGFIYFRKANFIAFAPAIITFIIINIYSLQPSGGDNNKITLWFVLFLALAATLLLYKMFTWKKGWRGLPLKVLVVALFFLATFSGWLADWCILACPYTIATPLEISASAWIINNTSPHAIFQSNCYVYTEDFVGTIAGRSTVLDIYTYNYNNGINQPNFNPNSASQAINSFFLAPSCGLINQYNISYVVIENITQKGSQYNCEPMNQSRFLNSPNFQEVYNATDSSSSVIRIFKTSC